MLEVQSIKTEHIIDHNEILLKIKTKDPVEIKNLVSWQDNTKDFSKPILDRYKDCILVCKDADRGLESESLIRKCFVKFIQRNGDEVEAEIYSSYMPDEFDLEEYSKSNCTLIVL